MREGEEDLASPAAAKVATKHNRPEPATKFLEVTQETDSGRGQADCLCGQGHPTVTEPRGPAGDAELRRQRLQAGRPRPLTLAPAPPHTARAAGPSWRAKPRTGTSARSGPRRGHSPPQPSPSPTPGSPSAHGKRRSHSRRSPGARLHLAARLGLLGNHS